MHDRSETSLGARARGFARLARNAAVGMLPALALLGVLEAGARVWLEMRNNLDALPLPLEAIGMLRPDPDLIFSLPPGVAVWDGRQLLQTNSLGLRSPEVGPKRPGEVRVLSLGESTTMGIGVDEDETYSARLEALLGARFPGRPWTVVNAGVASYSSYQSLLYLRERGLALQPDLVLFYHEVNDYLPSTYRHSGAIDFGVGLTDKQYQELAATRLHRPLLRWSGLYRLAFAQMASWRVERAGRAAVRNPLPTIGLPEIGLARSIVRTEGGEEREVLPSEYPLGRRVSEEERRWALGEVAALCRRRGIGLVLVHPSYAWSAPHECLLTDFARARGVPMLEAYPVLHRGPEDRGLFLDHWHPTAEGHARLAEALAGLLAGLPGFPGAMPPQGASAAP